MPSLVGLLEQITKRDNALGESLRALLETAAEMHSDDVVIIEGLCKERNGWRRQHASVHAQLIDERAEGKRLAKKLAEANAEWLRVTESYDEAKSRLTTRREYWEKRCLKAERGLARLKIVSADAEIGRLVRGMSFGSRLSRGNMVYRSEFWRDDAWWKTGSSYDDPAGALREIQEEERDA